MCTRICHPLHSSCLFHFHGGKLTFVWHSTWLSIIHYVEWPSCSYSPGFFSPQHFQLILCSPSASKPVLHLR